MHKNQKYVNQVVQSSDCIHTFQDAFDFEALGLVP